MEVTISYTAVKRDVRRMSEYIGLKAGAYDKLRALDKDDEQLRFWYDEGVTAVCSLLDRATERVERAESGDVSLVLSNRNDGAALVEGALRRTVACHVVVRWLKLVAPALVEGYAADEVQSLGELERLVYFREMPR